MGNRFLVRELAPQGPMPHSAWIRTCAFLFSLCMLSVFLWACPKATADVELDAAERAIQEARDQKAPACAKKTYQAAETALRQARKLADVGAVDQAKQKAKEAEALAARAGEAATPGCEQVDKAPAPAPNPTPPVPTTDASGGLSLESVIDTIYFDYNDASLRADSKVLLSKVAEVLTERPEVAIEIEGHCDVRGSTEYNLHLGERRARSVQKYLTSQGANARQIHIISYGEERPVDLSLEEAAHQRNRRAELRLKNK